jgi:DNA-binding winged helix-turn-helix (wHTH) protein
MSQEAAVESPITGSSEPRGRGMEDIHCWRFGPIDVDASEHRLAKDGRVVPLTHKAFALLVALLRRPGELVTKSELFAAVWPGVVVTDAALSRAIRELRVALDDSATTPRFIATVHGLGFRFIAPVLPELRNDIPSGRSGDDSCRLIGREADLDRLDSALSAARDGRRQGVFVSGEAGIGKTALVEWFIEHHCASDDLWVAQGRCIEQYGPGEAHLPILEALEQLARQVGAAAFIDAFSRYAPTWLAHLPWLAREVDPGLLKRASSDTTHQGMLRELAHALDVLSLRKTIVLWLEDLHWSDPSSLEVISFLAGRRDSARLLLIGSFRPADAASGASALYSVVLRLVQRGQAQEMTLRPMGPGEVSSYLRLRFGVDSGIPIDEWATFLHRRAGGNALFTVSMVDDLVRRGEVIEDSGRWRLRTWMNRLDDRLPDTLRRLVYEQIERLSDEDRRLVEAAAVVGASFNAAAAAAALQVDPADAEDRCVSLALRGRLLEQQPAVNWPDGTVSAGFRFVHALFWQGVNERVPEGRRAEWQRRIGLRQEQAWGAQCSTVATELAMRFEAANDVGRSLHYLRMAGAAALSRCAYPECIEQLRHGLDLVSKLPEPQRPRHELDLLLPLGAALMAAQGYASADVEAVYRRALTLCQVCGRPDDLMRALRGQWNVAFLRSDLAAARDAAGRLLTLAESLGDARMCVDAHTKLGQTCLHQGDLPAARSHLETALGSPASSADRAGLHGAPRVAAYLAWTLWYGGQPTRAAQVCDTALDLAQRADSPHSTAFALGYVSWVRLMRGEVELVQVLVERQLALSQDYGLTYWRQWADFIAGAVMTRQGRLTDGIAVMRQAIDEMQASGGKVGVPCLLCLLAEAQLTAGQFGAARVAVAHASELITANGNALYAAEARRLEGLLARAEDDGRIGREVARRTLEAALEIAQQQGARALELRAAISLSRLTAADGDLRHALDVLVPVRAGFGDGFDTEDLTRADDLLRSLTKDVEGLAPERA